MRLRSILQRPLRRYILALVLVALSLPFWPGLLTLAVHAFLGERKSPPIGTLLRDREAFDSMVRDHLDRPSVP